MVLTMQYIKGRKYKARVKTHEELLASGWVEEGPKYYINPDESNRLVHDMAKFLGKEVVVINKGSSSSLYEFVLELDPDGYGWTRGMFKYIGEPKKRSLPDWW